MIKIKLITKETKIIIDDEELSKNGLLIKHPNGYFSPLFVSWLDGIMGFATELLDYNYDCLSHRHFLIIREYNARPPIKR